MLEQGARRASARRLIDPARAASQRRAVGVRRPDQLDRRRHDLSLGDRPRRQHRVADSEHLRRVRQRPRAAGHRLRAAQSRRAVHARRDASERARAAQASAAHDHSRGSCRRTTSGSGSGSWAGSTRRRPTRSSSPTSPTTAATSSRRSRPGRFTKPTFTGRDVYVEALVPEPVRRELAALGHDVDVVPPRTGIFGYGQAVMSDGAGVHFGASEPRHDGAAIPEAPPVTYSSEQDWLRFSARIKPRRSSSEGAERAFGTAAGCRGPRRTLPPVAWWTSRSFVQQLRARVHGPCGRHRHAEAFAQLDDGADDRLRAPSAGRPRDPAASTSCARRLSRRRPSAGRSRSAARCRACAATASVSAISSRTTVDTSG